MSNSARVIVTAAVFAVPFSVAPLSEGAAQALEDFAIVAGSTITSTGTTLIDGNIALSPGTSFTVTGVVKQTNGKTFIADPVARRIKDDLTTLYGVLEGHKKTSKLIGPELDTQVLTAGFYKFGDSANLASNGTLLLDAQGDPDAVFIFNIESTLTVGSYAKVKLINGAQGGNVFYRIGSSATLDTSSELEGQIVAQASVTMNTSAKIKCGAAYARVEAVTLDTNTINICTLAGNGDNGSNVGDEDNGGNAGNGGNADNSVRRGNAVLRGLRAVVNDPDAAAQARTVANDLWDHVAGGGSLQPGLALLAATQPTDAFAAILAQVAGEVSTGVAPMVMQSMDAFLDTVARSGRTSRGPVAAPQVQAVPVGVVREDAYYPGKFGSKLSTPHAQTQVPAPSVAPDLRNWEVWASGYGSRNVTDGDAMLGHQKRTSQNKGIAAGVNFLPSDRTDVGVALSWNTADFNLSNGFGSGASDTILVALRGRTSSDRAYLKGVLAYGRSDITTDRTVTIAGIDRFTAETTGETFAAHVETGYHLGMFTPFAGLRALSFSAPAYSETTASGSSSFALGHDAQTTRSLRSELGVDMQWSADTAGPGTAGFGVRAAWVHEFASNDPSTSSFQRLPDVSFPVSGATRNRDSLVLAANATFTNSNGVFIDGAINTEYSKNSKDFGGALTMGYRW